MAASGGSDRHDCAKAKPKSHHSPVIKDLEINIRLLSQVKEDFELTAKELDSQKQKIHNAKVNSVLAATTAGTAGAITAFFTFGASAMAAVGFSAAIIVALLVYLSGVVEQILQKDELKGLVSKWKDMKRNAAKEMNIPRDSDQAINDWAKTRLSPEQADAVAAALKKATSSSATTNSTERLKRLDSKFTVSLLESLLGVIAVDFSLFEVLVGALKEKDDPGDAVRHLAWEMNKYEKQLQQKLDVEREKEKHHVRIVVNLPPDGTGSPGIGSPGDIPETNISQSQASIISQRETHNKPMLIDLQKETDVEESNLLSSYTAARTTQTDPAPVLNVPASPVFCIGPTWQIHGSIDRSGGYLQKPKSDVALKIPPNAIAHDEYVDVHMSVCADVEQIHRSLDLKDSDFVVSPLAEFWAGEKFRFQRPVQIVLPHCLPRGVNLDEVIVYRATKNIRGELILQQVPNQQQSASKANNTVSQVAPSGSSDVQPSYHLEGNKLVINTDGFSSYTCVHCKRKNKGTPTLLFVGSGENKLRTDTMTQTASVHVHVWDERLDVRDFLENIAPTRKTDMERLTLYPVKDVRETMTFRLDIIGGNASSWRHQLRRTRPGFEEEQGRPGFDEEQTINLAALLGCENKSCSVSHATTLHWKLETVSSSPVGHWLECVVEIVHQASQTKASMPIELQGPRGGSTELRRDVLETLTLDELRMRAQGMGVSEATISDINRRNRSNEARKMQLIAYLLQRVDPGREQDRKKKQPGEGSEQDRKKKQSGKESKHHETKGLSLSNMSSPSSSSATCDSTASDSSDDWV